ncbi:hypothetical protein SKA53_04948 [Yoonia vestfoldensis SKA53]|uniref:Uncharacterized protein n=1 Tax=Yoonia vestfoldensis SKA53 TaxID=314232 RepID=A3V683_9RHOB|nr:hypothetical protein SKA53_04948 [Yoonia vestfoldensis SKA53]
MKYSLIKNLLIELMLVSLLYIAAFALTFGLLMPAQRMVLPEFANYASILFLPHGVRVLTAWLFGLRAVLLLAPGGLLTHGFLHGTAGFSIDYFFAALFGIICATSTFWLFATMRMDFHRERAKTISWREILLAGSFASVINVAGTSYFYGSDIQSSSAYFIGDLGGLLACMVILMFGFRWIRRARP